MGILFENVYLTEKRYIFIECNAWKTRLMTVLPMMSNSTTVDDQLKEKNKNYACTCTHIYVLFTQALRIFFLKLLEMHL